MADKEWIADYLAQYYEEVHPFNFYRAIFPEGALEKMGEFDKGKYRGLAVELLTVEGESKPRVKRHTVTDDLSRLDVMLQSENFILISPISYIGKHRTADNARFIYALAIDLDGIEKKGNLVDLFHQIQKVDYIPTPTYIVWSGTGLHLYFQFVKPIPCFRNITKQLSILKQALTRKIWNMYTTTLSTKPQYESLFQGFRLVGGVTKAGGRTKAFITGDPVTIEYLNQYVDSEKQVKDFKYKTELTLAEAEKKYPEWYQRRINDDKPRGAWTCHRGLYDWWLGRVQSEAVEGHRYHAVMCLAIYAKKCGIPKEELENDALGLVSVLDDLTISEDNHFTEEDVMCALEMYNDNYYVFSADAVARYSRIPIEHNKRNHRKQALHLARARAVQEFDDKMNNTNWRKGNGRKSKQAAVQEWRLKNPEGKKADCIRETGLSKPTVYKHWNI